MTLCFLGALFIYTRIIRKEVNQQLSVEVNKMVENYVNLATKKNTSTPNSYSKFESWFWIDINAESNQISVFEFLEKVHGLRFLISPVIYNYVCAIMWAMLK